MAGSGHGGSDSIAFHTFGGALFLAINHFIIKSSRPSVLFQSGFDSHRQTNFTIKETLCRKSDTRTLDECDFKKDGVRIWAEGKSGDLVTRRTEGKPGDLVTKRTEGKPGDLVRRKTEEKPRDIMIRRTEGKPGDQLTRRTVSKPGDLVTRRTEGKLGELVSDQED
uniref:Uncharacterized protein n=1 Tax=Leptobrachium leishanense TaxID=445787 RepID=A0A8C5MAN8_9ANUR